MQLRFDELEAANAKLLKTIKNKKKALKRVHLSRSETGSLNDSTGEHQAKVQVVHAYIYTENVN